MADFGFEVVARDSRSGARLGRLTTPHGVVDTPAFIPVASQASVKGISPGDVAELGGQIVLANTYHLYLRPGADLIARMGGLRAFMGWPGPLVTDSGGFQVFSLGLGREQGVGKIGGMFPGRDHPLPPPVRQQQPRLVEVDEDGVTFVSHLDGSRHRFTAEVSLDIQQKLGADIMFALDECTSPLSDYDYVRRAVRRTHAWAERSLAARRTSQALFGIIQGGEFLDLRDESCRFLSSLPFDGYGIGGSLGKTKTEMHAILDFVMPRLPEDRPRHLLGIGEPDDLWEGAYRGVDLFDCAAPTRMARHATLLTRRGRLNIQHSAYREDPRPVEDGCPCYTCTHFSRAYLRHLFRARELLGLRLATLHNLHFVLALASEIRQSIREGRLVERRYTSLAAYGTLQAD
ncbi:MAG: tRNA guanosine(34) transglycosylase Tgt [Chloroflexi bacterium]|nr:tRNA guanosine(34) transglycosylase Tgt [Chloroflexota bacterium]